MNWGVGSREWADRKTEETKSIHDWQFTIGNSRLAIHNWQFTNLSLILSLGSHQLQLPINHSLLPQIGKKGKKVRIALRSWRKKTICRTCEFNVGGAGRVCSLACN
jgi:hypothetical protein